MALGKRVHQRRKELGLTQEQLAEAIGKSQSVIQSLESRDSKKSAHAEALARALGVTLEWLTTGKGPMHADADHALNAKLSDEARYLELAQQIERLPPETRAVLMISLGRDPDEPLPKELTESIRRMLDNLADLVRQEHNRAD